MKNFRKLDVWQKAHALTIKVYKETSKYPTEESFGLTSQLRRAASSVPTNIAEGCGRGRDGDLKRFLEIAMGSAAEVDYLLQLSKEIGYLDDKIYRDLNSDTTTVRKMITSFVIKLKANS